jgi:uncharacterized coiled-coil protein SlyX
MTKVGVLKQEIAELDKQIAEQVETLRKQRLKLRNLRHVRELKLELLNKLEASNN